MTRLIKYGHACVRLERDGAALVVDPGAWSDPATALAGADAVLITHEHFDHVDADAVRAAGVPVFAPASVAAQLDGASVVAAGEEFEAAGFIVRAHGGQHALIHGDVPIVANLGYVIETGSAGTIYHPGDSFTVPDETVDTLLVPVGGPWLKIGEVIDFVRAVRPARAHPIHDAMLGEFGLGSVDMWLGKLGRTDYSRLPSASPAKRP